MSAKTKAEALEDLRRFMPEGSTVYTICRHVAKSGMSAVYSLVVFLDGDDLHPNYSAHIVTGRPLRSVSGQDGILVRGCGYDRARAIVDDIARELYGRDNALKQRSL